MLFLLLIEMDRLEGPNGEGIHVGGPSGSSRHRKKDCGGRMAGGAAHWLLRIVHAKRWLEAQRHQDVAKLHGLVDGRPELSSALGIFHVHTNGSCRVRGTQKIEQISGIESDVQGFLSILGFDRLPCFTLFRRTCGYFESILLQSQPHAGHAIIGQQRNTPHNVRELLGLQLHCLSILLRQDRFVVRELAGEKA